MDDNSENSQTNKMDSHAENSEEPQNYIVVDLRQKKGRVTMEHNRFNDEHDDDNHHKNEYMDGIETRIPPRGTGLKLFAVCLLSVRFNL